MINMKKSNIVLLIISLLIGFYAFNISVAIDSGLFYANSIYEALKTVNSGDVTSSFDNILGVIKAISINTYVIIFLTTLNIIILVRCIIIDIKSQRNKV